MHDLKQIGQGRTADIFEYDERKILKLFKQDFPTRNIEDEFKTSKYIYSLGLSTPKAFELIEIENRIGIVFERVFGSSMLGIMTSKPWSINIKARQLAKLHDNVHKLSAPELYLKQKDVLKDNINYAPLLTEEEKKQIILYIEELPEDNKLCHGDFHPDNVLIGDDVWIIDWMTGMSGHPAGDVARSVLLFSYGTLPEGTPKLIKVIVDLLRKRLKNEYINQYIKLSGYNYSEIEKWLLPIAAARLVEWIPEEEKEILLKTIRERIKLFQRRG